MPRHTTRNSVATPCSAHLRHTNNTPHDSRSRKKWRPWLRLVRGAGVAAASRCTWCSLRVSRCCCCCAHASAPASACVCATAALLLRDDIALCWLRCAASPLRRVAVSPSSCAAVCCVDVVVLRVSLPPLLAVSVAGTASSAVGVRRCVRRYSTPPHRQQQCVWSVCVVVVVSVVALTSLASPTGPLLPSLRPQRAVTLCRVPS
jgi:hypothetical protein